MIAPRASNTKTIRSINLDFLDETPFELSFAICLPPLIHCFNPFILKCEINYSNDKDNNSKNNRYR